MTTAKIVKDETGATLGEVRRVSENYQPAPGQMSSRTVYRAVPVERMTHASSAGCPSFDRQRDAVDALRVGNFII